MVSGGSLVSWSLTFAAKTVTVQVSLDAKSAVGSSVKVVGPPLTAAVWEPLVPQEIEYQEPLTFTGSLKVIETLAFTATSVAPFAGVVLETDGATSPWNANVGNERLRGFGAPAVKSAAVLSVSVQPLPFRSAAVVFVSAGVGEPSNMFAPS